MYLAQKHTPDTEADPVKALRLGWDRHVRFGLSHPALYQLMYAQAEPGRSSAAELSFAMLRRHMDRVAAAGKLRIPEERAVALFHSAALGIVLTLVRSLPTDRDLTLSSMARDNTLSMIAVTGDLPSEQSPVSAAARTLDAAIEAGDGFSPGELTLLREWLGRLKSY